MSEQEKEKDFITVADLKLIDIVSDWVKQINASKNTERNYQTSLKYFCCFTGKIPDELLIEAEKEEDTFFKLNKV